MLERILRFSIEHRWLVVLAVVVAAVVGAWSLTQLPIDAVPDITNRQVQINAVAPALSPIEVEKQVTYPLENALAGIPGLEYTRSLSRNGFSQVTAVFDDAVDVYFARQQVSERLTTAREDLPPGIELVMGPISTGLGENMADELENTRRDAALDWLLDPHAWYSHIDVLGRTHRPDGEVLRNELELAAYLRTVQDWIIRPQLKSIPGVAGIDAMGGFVKQ
jgi:cobalt-zinc-cadmium resistance protein CzcA